MVVVPGTQLVWIAMKTDVPQESILGPLPFFSIHINDIVEDVGSFSTPISG